MREPHQNKIHNCSLAVLTYKNPTQLFGGMGSLDLETALNNAANYFSGFDIAILSCKKTVNAGWVA